MNIGEIGNFISYGFAPASVVAPLGTVRDFYRIETRCILTAFLVCSDSQLLLCASYAERKVQKSEMFRIQTYAVY